MSAGCHVADIRPLSRAMSLLTATRKLLSEMVSPDAFEALATAVLREADSAYAALIHVGTNVAGRAVRSPIDGIGLRRRRGGRRLLLVQHTITARKALRRKWLDPKEGDVGKALAILATERKRGAVRAATLVLCSAADPDEELIRDVHEAVGAALDVDIWPGSRIADFLDRHPEGQWLRQCAFGTEAVRLSLSQARAIARQSLDDFLPLVPRDEVVARALDPVLAAFARGARGAGFVIGESGLGKSVALRRLGDHWLADGGIAIVVDHETIERAATIDQAITLALRKWAPGLDAGCGHAALSLAATEHPLLLIVEDVNRSANPRRIVERLIGWSGAGNIADMAAPWRLLCPVWRGNAGLSDSQLRDRVLNRSLAVDEFEPTEAIAAVLGRARAAGAALSALQAGGLATALGNDPLLIGLNADWASPDPRGAIESYIAANFAAAADDRLLASDLRAALGQIAERSVTARTIAPTWAEIRKWLAADTDSLAGVRRLVDQGRVVRLGGDDRLAYRHDRVRDHLLVRAIVRLIETDRFDPELWAEPFYAGLIGAALTMLPLNRIEEAEQRNPVALFAALQDVSLDSERQARLLAAAERWTASPGFSDPATESVQSHALRYLMRTDGPFVIKLVKPFTPSFWKLEALARNGAVGAAAAICRSSDMGVRDSWRDRIVDHALARFPGFVDDLAALLVKPGLTGQDLEGALSLAGETGDMRLCDALAARWEMEGGAAALSTGWLWAVLRCCPPVGHPLANEVCRAWAALPSKVRHQNKRDDNPRWDIAGSSLPWGFSRKPDPASVAYLMSLPKSHRGLNDVVYTIVSHVDLPAAVVGSVRKAAAIDRRIEGKGSINLFRHDLERRWWPEQRGYALSADSRAALGAIWRNRRRDRFDRRTAFRVWCLTPTAAELADLPELEVDPVLADQALRTQLAAGDRSAVPLLSGRLQTGDRGWAWWFHARRVGLGGLEPDIRRYFAERRRNPPEISDNDRDHILAELLMDSRSDFAAATIIENWDQLQASTVFVQAALYLATTDTIALARAAVRTSDNPARMLDYINMSWGIRITGRPGVADLAQLRALEPFLAMIGEGQYGEMRLGDLFLAANQIGALDWRKQHLDPILTASRFGHKMSASEALFASLDREVLHSARFGSNWPFADHWFEEREKELWTRDALLALVADWAVSRASEGATRMLCEAVVQFGERQDLVLLDRIPAPLRDACATKIAGCRYGVRRRSL